MHDEPLITTGEVARRLGVTPGAVSRWAKRKMITPAVITPGGRYRWRWSQVARQLHELHEQQLREEQERDE